MTQSLFTKAELDTEMTVVRNEFEPGENNPYLVLWKRLQAVAFDWHNYGNLPIGARSDIENVPFENLRAFYQRYYQPDNAVLIVAGKFDPAATLDLVAKHFGAIPQADPRAAGAVHRRAGAGRRARRSPCAAPAATSWSPRCTAFRRARTPTSSR